MFTSRKLIVCVVFVLLLFVGVSSVAAASASSPEIKPDFTIPADQCSSLPPGVSVDGFISTNQTVTHDRTLPDGSTQVFTHNLIKGTATDSNGGAHKFVYVNNSTDTTLPGGEHQISMIDSFELTGPGPHYSVGFNWRWTYTPPALWPPVDNWEKISTHGDPFMCDPL